MKPSKYNVFVPWRGEYILYNTLNETEALIDNEMKELLESGDLETLTNEPLASMKSHGFIIEDYIDELRILRTERKFARCHNFGNYLNVTLMVTYQCNLACPYCDEVLAKNHHESMNKETADIALKFIENEAVREHHTKAVDLLFYGGEPLLNWSCCKYILEKLEGDYSHLQCIFRIITNGTLFNDPIIEEVIKYNINNIDITFDGAKPDHDCRRITHKGEGTYDTIMNNLISLVDAGASCNLKVNVDKENCTRVEQLFEDLIIHGLKDINLSINPISYPKVAPKRGPDYCLEEDDLPVFIPKIWRLAKKWGFIVSTKPKRGPACCMNTHFSSYIVDPLLDVCKCSEFVGIDHHVVGKIRQDGKFVPNNLLYYGIARDPTYLEKCSACNLLPICTEAPCVALSYGKFNDYYETRCFRVKYLFEESLRWYVELLEIINESPRTPQEV